MTVATQVTVPDIRVQRKQSGDLICLRREFNDLYRTKWVRMRTFGQIIHNGEHTP